jgi:hypothetical protein
MKGYRLHLMQAGKLADWQAVSMLRRSKLGQVNGGLG